MEDIFSDSFSSTLSYLPNASITALRTNTNLDKNIKESAKANIFWKQRIETVLERYLVEQKDDIAPNWKLVYNNLIEDLEGTYKLGNITLTTASKKGHYEVVKLLPTLYKSWRESFRRQ